MVSLLSFSLTFSLAESICDDPAIIERNIRSVKISSPDARPVPFSSLDAPIDTVIQYRGWDPNLAVQDYYSRIRDHEKHYETVDELDVASIRIINVCFQCAARGIFLPLIVRLRLARRSWSM